MHKSRLAGFIIDCQTDDLTTAATFWSEALGYQPKPTTDDTDDIGYVVLDTGATDLRIEVQRVQHPSRVHLDIETDDIDAEVARLETLGAKRVKQVKSWWVMEAPTGQRFCVIAAEEGTFDHQG